MYEIEPEAFATGWILTNLAWIVSFGITYELMDIIIHEWDHMLILYMSVAALKIHWAELLS